jgi:hypothetical protein
MSADDKFYFYLYYACVGFNSDDIYDELKSTDNIDFKGRCLKECKNVSFHNKKLFHWGEDPDYIDNFKKSIDDIENCYFNIQKKVIEEVISESTGAAEELIIEKVEWSYLIFIVNGIIQRRCMSYTEISSNDIYNLFIEYRIQNYFIIGYIEKDIVFDHRTFIIDNLDEFEKNNLFLSLSTGQFLSTNYVTNLDINFYKALTKYNKADIKNTFIFLMGETVYNRIGDYFIINIGFKVICKIIDFLLDRRYINKDMTYYRSQRIGYSLLPIRLKNAIRNLDYYKKIELINFLRNNPNLLKILESDEYGRNEVYELINLNYLESGSIEVKNKNNLISVYI